MLSRVSGIFAIKPRIIGWAGHLARTIASRSACKVLIGMSEGNIPVRIRTHRWKYDIKMDLKQVGWYGLDLS
jgi:hypothetical protein